MQKEPVCSKTCISIAGQLSLNEFVEQSQGSLKDQMIINFRKNFLLPTKDHDFDQIKTIHLSFQQVILPSLKAA